MRKTPPPLHNRYFLMRHAESTANARNLIISDPEKGIPSYGLTSVGREQANRAARLSRLASDTLIVCSDFKRTQETAKIAERVLKAPPVELNQGLRERYFGELEGDSGERYLDVWAFDETDPKHTQFGVESAQALALRLGQTLQGLEERYQQKTILLVSHGDTLRFLQLVANGLPLTDHLKIERFRPAEIRALDELPWVVEPAN